LGQPFFEEVNTKLDVEILVLEVVGMLLTVQREKCSFSESMIDEHPGRKEI